MLDAREGGRVTGTVAIEDLEIGMTRSVSKTICDRSIELFAELSTDRNPVHLDEEYARETMFGGRIAHGMLTAALLSAVIGEQLPGHGTVYLKQELKFLAPVRPGDRVEARVKVAGIDRDSRRVTLDCRCTVGNTVVLRGEAVVLAPKSVAAEPKPGTVEPKAGSVQPKAGPAMASAPPVAKPAAAAAG